MATTEIYNRSTTQDTVTQHISTQEITHHRITQETLTRVNLSLGLTLAYQMLKT